MTARFLRILSRSPYSSFASLAAATAVIQFGMWLLHYSIIGSSDLIAAAAIHTATSGFIVFSILIVAELERRRGVGVGLAEAARQYFLATAVLQVPFLLMCDFILGVRQPEVATGTIALALPLVYYIGSRLLKLAAENS